MRPLLNQVEEIQGATARIFLCNRDNQAEMGSYQLLACTPDVPPSLVDLCDDTAKRGDRYANTLRDIQNFHFQLCDAGSIPVFRKLAVALSGCL